MITLLFSSFSTILLTLTRLQLGPLAKWNALVDERLACVVQEEADRVATGPHVKIFECVLGRFGHRVCFLRDVELTLGRTSKLEEWRGREERFLFICETR